MNFYVHIYHDSLTLSNQRLYDSFLIFHFFQRFSNNQIISKMKKCVKLNQHYFLSHFANRRMGVTKFLLELVACIVMNFRKKLHTVWPRYERSGYKNELAYKNMFSRFQSTCSYVKLRAQIREKPGYIGIFSHFHACSYIRVRRYSSVW